MESIVDKFIRYIKIDTQSDMDSESNPSTVKQFDLARLLVQELQALGLKDAAVDDKCYVMATLPANTSKTIPAIGWIAHMDTSPDASGANVNPRLIPAYDGAPITLDAPTNTILSPADFPDLLKYVGQAIITTDGKTLLGADDKAGVAIILAMLEHLQANLEIQHGKLCISFTPDEEIGHGADHFDVQKFGADIAYTVDGDEIGELEYECFNASMARIHIQGRNVHPGKSKDKMVNAMQLAMDLHAMLPVDQRPEYTDNYEGFFHLLHFNGTVEETDIMYIIRDHDRVKFEHKEQVLREAIAFMNERIGSKRIHMELTQQYQNMREVLEPNMHIVDTAREAMEQVGVTPIIKPIRGGTDGSRLSYMGLPTPNIFTGGHNGHGKYEFIPVRSMEKAVKVVLKIIELYTTK
ncbi:MAG: peptidase T [Anaerolinea sp.]|nr:peptidase T [Anaerolinea sp.]